MLWFCDIFHVEDTLCCSWRCVGVPVSLLWNYSAWQAVVSAELGTRCKTGLTRKDNKKI